MAKVICTLPNASEFIGGVKFVSHRDGMISQEISAEQAERFCSIPGYELVVANGETQESGTDPQDSAAKPATARGTGKAKEASKKTAGGKEAPADKPIGTAPEGASETAPHQDPAPPADPIAPPVIATNLTPGF